MLYVYYFTKQPIMKTELKTRREIAKQLNIHPTTLYRKLKLKGIKLSSGLLDQRQQALIIAVLSSPLDEETATQPFPNENRLVS
jgi:hypothetical protein